MPKKFYKTSYFLDDQDCAFSETLQSFYMALMPDYSVTLIKHQSSVHHIPRSFSQDDFRPNVLNEFQACIRYLRSMRRTAIIKWSVALRSAAIKENRSKEEIMLFEKVVSVSCEFFKLKCMEISQNRILDFLRDLKIIQRELKERNLKNLDCLITEIIHHIKHLGRVIYYFFLVNEDSSMKEVRDYNTQLHAYARKDAKTINFVTEKILKFYKWKMRRWCLERQLQKQNQNQEIMITCKICLNKVSIGAMDAHSANCLKRAESMKELNSLIKNTNKYIAMIVEIKQFLITKTKLDIKFLKSSERQQCDIARMMTYSQEMIPPLSNSPFLFPNHPPMSAQEIPRRKETFNSERESANLFDNIKFLETSNKDFQTKKISEFAKNSARKRGVTLIAQPLWKKDSTGSLGKKKSKMGLLGLLFKRNQLKSLGTSPEIDDIQGEIYQEKVQRKNSDTSVEIKGERFHGSHDMAERKISLSNEDFEDMFSDDNHQSDNGSESSGSSIKVNVLYLKEVIEGTQEKKRHSIEAKELFADEIIEERTPLILENSPKLATLNLEETPQNFRNRTPRSAINLDRPEFKHQLNCSNTYKISKIQAEKKEIIKKDKAIKACIMLEENLRQVNETEFSKKSLRKLEVSLQLLNEINLTLNQKEGYEHDKVMELLDFVNKMIEMGTHHLKYRFTQRNLVHHEIVKKSERSSNLIRMSNSLGSMEHWQSSKEDLQQKPLEIEEKEAKEMFLIDSDMKKDKISPKNQTNESKRVFLEAESIKFEKTLFGYSQDCIPKERTKPKDFGRFNIRLLPNKKGGGRRKLHFLHHREIYGKKIIKKPSFQIRLLEEEALIKKLNNLKKPEGRDMQHSVIIKQTPNKLHNFSKEKNIMLKKEYINQKENNEKKFDVKNEKSSFEEDNIEDLIYQMKEHYSDSDIQNIAKPDIHSPDKSEISINDFEILNLIGKGAYGRVYLVKRKRTEDLYAMKIINTMDDMNKNKMDSLQTESEIFDLVTSEFVVKAIFKFKHDVFFCFVMEYMHGGDFNRLLQIYGRFDEKIARFYIAELVLAVEHLHNVGVVHRDLKPDNILLDSKGHIKLTDFGLSDIAIATLTINKKKPNHKREEKFHRFLSKFNISEKILNVPREYRFVESSLMNCKKESTEEEKKLSNDMSSKHSLKKIKNQHRIIGTPDYIAPEILTGVAGSLNNPSVDLWSLGVIFFEFLIGVPPFSDETVDKIFDNINNMRVPWDEITVQEKDFEEGTEDSISRVAMDLMKKLLVADPKERLNITGIKSHDFFSGIDWSSLIYSTPPIVPEPIQRTLLSPNNDISLFDPFPNSIDNHKIQTSYNLEIQQLLEENIRFDLLHMENQKIAKETMSKVKVSEEPFSITNLSAPMTSMIDKYSLDLEGTLDLRPKNFSNNIIQKNWEALCGKK